MSALATFALSANLLILFWLAVGLMHGFRKADRMMIAGCVVFMVPVALAVAALTELAS